MSAWAGIAAAITAVFALVGVLITVTANQHSARRDRLLKDFAEALAAVERYAELPYRIRRRQGTDPETRERLSETIHGVQQDLLFHQSWVRIQDTYVAEAYNALVAATRKEAGRAMTEAWKTKPVTSDEDMPLGVGLRFPEMEQKRVEYINVVHWRLQWPPLRWVRGDVIPYVFGLLNKTGSNRP